MTAISYYRGGRCNSGHDVIEGPGSRRGNILWPYRAIAQLSSSGRMSALPSRDSSGAFFLCVHADKRYLLLTGSGPLRGYVGPFEVLYEAI